MNNPLYKTFQRLFEYRNRLEDENYASYKTFSPVAISDIEKWEKEHEAKLPEGYRNWLLLSNGFDMNIHADIFPLEKICKYTFPEYDNYFIIGNYIGDGSMLIMDKNGGFYELDHYSELQETTFENFLENWIIDGLEEAMMEIGAMKSKNNNGGLSAESIERLMNLVKASREKQENDSSDNS